MKVEVNKENFEKYLVIVNEVYELLHNIKEDTGHLSTSIHIFRHKDFKTLVEKGDKLVPFLFYFIGQYGGDWIIFHLLHEITGAHPVPKEDFGRFYHTMMYWLKWFIESDYYKNNDVYHGLVAG